MNITLFGGSFNPPHLGHALIAQDFLAYDHTDELWLLPAYQHTFGKDLAPAHHRLEMSKLLVNYLNIKHKTLNIKLCSLEIDHQLSGQTYQTLQLLKSKPSNTDVSFSFLIGSDQLPHFHKWHHHQELLEQMTFWVYPRVGFPMDSLLPGMKAFTHPDQTITNFSSTLIRHRLEHNTDTSLLLPQTISDYIQKHQLYQD